jgi:ataxin-10
LDKFLPRINFGKSVPPTGPSPDTSTSGTPQTQQAGAITTCPADNQGFAYLKRDLVRMLGILCHEKKMVQDRTREAGGIEVVMNMCVIDDRNPCKSVLSETFVLRPEFCEKI